MAAATAAAAAVRRLLGNGHSRKDGRFVNVNMENGDERRNTKITSHAHGPLPLPQINIQVVTVATIMEFCTALYDAERSPLELRDGSHGILGMARAPCARTELARNASRRRHPFIEHLVVDGDGDAADLKLYNFGRQRRLNLSLLHLAHDR